jgi:bifunctional non-homologous end joining protein LigD
MTQCQRVLTQLLGTDRAGLLISQPIDAAADVAFQHICSLGLEGIVSKKLGSRYESGRSSLWLKTINPNAPALQRLEQENWRG